MYSIFSSSKELFEYLIEMCRRNNFDYEFIWDIIGEDIIDIIPSSKSLIVVDDECGKDYLGNKYSLKEIGHDDI